MTALTKIAGAVYAAAVLNDDRETVEIFRSSFTQGELLTAVEAQLSLLGRYLGYHLGKSPAEVGASMRRAAAHSSKEA